MKSIEKNKELVAYCGLYCGTCKRYLKGKCVGCHDFVKATWCKLRTCCIENGYATCAECKTYSNANDCKKFNNWISKIFVLLFKSNRKGCIDRIKDVGLDKFVEEMAEAGEYNKPIKSIDK